MPCDRRFNEQQGKCYDCASVETFFKSLKAERIWRPSWPTRGQAEAAIFQYINGFDNTRRVIGAHPLRCVGLQIDAQHIAVLDEIIGVGGA